AAAFIHAARFVPVASVLASIAIVIAIPVAPKSPIIISVSIAAAPAALALGALLVLAAAPLGIFVAEPGGDLIARSVPEAAVVLPPALARVIALREGAAIAIGSLVRPSGAFITRHVPRVVAIISHISPPA